MYLGDSSLDCNTALRRVIVDLHKENKKLTQEKEALEAENAELRQRLAEVEKENFALSAGVCNNGYGDEYGHCVCNHRWISVDDRLPEKTQEGGGSGFSDYVLVLDEEGDIYKAFYFFPWRNDRLEGFRVVGEDDCEEITHWMPLPSTKQITGDL